MWDRKPRSTSTTSGSTRLVTCWPSLSMIWSRCGRQSVGRGCTAVLVRTGRTSRAPDDSPTARSTDECTSIEVRIIEMESGESLGTLPTGLADGLFTSWSPDEDRLAIGNQNETVVIDAMTGDVLALQISTAYPARVAARCHFVRCWRGVGPPSRRRQRERSSRCLAVNSEEHGAIT